MICFAWMAVYKRCQVVVLCRLDTGSQRGRLKGEHGIGRIDLIRAGMGKKTCGKEEEKMLDRMN